MKDTLLIFDLDGTLWDSAGPVAEAWNEVFQRECPGLPLLTKEDIHSVMGMTMKEIGQTLYADISIPRRDEIFDICCVYEVEYLHSHCGTLYPDFRSTMEALRAEGYDLAIVGRDSSTLEETSVLATAKGVKVLKIEADLTQTPSYSMIVEKTVEHFGGLDVLVNCAGLAQSEPFDSISPDTYDSIMSTNVRIPYLLTQEALPLLRKSPLATVINICSVCAHKGYPLQSVYSASKHALLGWSKSLANEVYNENVRIHIISPGGVYTDMVRIARPDLSPEGMTLAEDVAEAAAFFLTMRRSDAVVDEIELHRPAKAPFA